MSKGTITFLNGYYEGNIVDHLPNGKGKWVEEHDDFNESAVTVPGTIKNEQR